MAKNLTQKVNPDDVLDSSREESEMPRAIGPDGTVYHSVEEVEKGYEEGKFDHHDQFETALDDIQGISD